jgi:hypothetical protein
MSAMKQTAHTCHLDRELDFPEYECIGSHPHAEPAGTGALTA